MTPADVIALFQDPKKLLRRCYLHIAGGATRTPSLPDLPPPPANGQAAIATFEVEIATNRTVQGFTSGVSGWRGEEKDRAFVKITKRSGAAKTVLAANEFNAYYIPMVQTSDVTQGTSHYTLPTVSGSLDIMITSKLSGCTFGVGSDAHGAVLVSHVQPNKATDGDVQRAQELDTALTGGFNVKRGEFGIGRQYAELGAVIGRRSGTKWKFYLQATSMSKTDLNAYAINGLEAIK